MFLVSFREENFEKPRPLEKRPTSIHDPLSPEDMNTICGESYTISKVLGHALCYGLFELIKHDDLFNQIQRAAQQ